MKAFCFLILSGLLFFIAPLSAFASDEKPTVVVDLVTGDLNSQARYYSYTFPNTPTYYTRYATFRLTNQSNYTIQVYNVSLWGGAFTSNSDCWGYLGPYQSCYTQVGFRPYYQGYYSGQLRFGISSGDVYLNLYGWGVYY